MAPMPRCQEPQPAHALVLNGRDRGFTIEVRPIRPDDAAAMLALHGRLSERTRYLRFFSPYPHVLRNHLDRAVNVDHEDREALVVLCGSDIVAVGRYDRVSPGSSDAELALVVEDAYQRRGIGSTVLIHLARAALDSGIDRFVGTVLPANDAISRMIRSFGYEVHRSTVGGLVQLSFSLRPAENIHRRNRDIPCR
jgi:GNAT superfamily N-acetyltransferase